MATSRRPAPVQTTTVDSAVWERAMELAAGDGRRIEVLDERTVMVRNHPVR